MGAFSPRRFDVFVGRALTQSYLTYQYNQSEKTGMQTAAFGLGSAAIWWRPLNYISQGLKGWGFRGLLTGAGRLLMNNPVTAGITAVLIGGYVHSQFIDPEEGGDNYLGFLTGGDYGNDPNYWDTDENNSGYFNVGQNTANVMDWYTAQENAEAIAQAEAEYIQTYWDEKDREAWQARVDEGFTDEQIAYWQGRI